MKLNIVMVEPEIPQNTGNIARTCAITGAKLHLVHPLGFKIDEKSVKRAGLDYWDKLDIEEHKSLEDFLNKYKPEENNMIFCNNKRNYKIYRHRLFNNGRSICIIWKRNKRITRTFTRKIFRRKNNKNTNVTNFKVIEFVKFCCNYYI